MDKSEAVCVEHFENGGSKCAEDDLAQQGAMLVEAEMKLPLGTAIKLFWKPLLISEFLFVWIVLRKTMLTPLQARSPSPRP